MLDTLFYLHLQSDAVMETLANRYGVSKATLLDPTNSDAASRMALAESFIIQETRDYLSEVSKIALSICLCIATDLVGLSGRTESMSNALPAQVAPLIPPSYSKIYLQVAPSIPLGPSLLITDLYEGCSFRQLAQ